MKPVNGGIPLRESSMIGTSNCMRGDSVLILLNWFLLDCRVQFKAINRGVMIIQYII